jgi:hypothetical protein
MCNGNKRILKQTIRFLQRFVRSIKVSNRYSLSSLGYRGLLQFFEDIGVDTLEALRLMSILLWLMRSLMASYLCMMPLTLSLLTSVPRRRPNPI